MRVTRRRPRTKIVTHTRTYRRVGKSSGTNKILLVGGLVVAGLVVYQMMNNRRQTYGTQYVPTGNQYRDNSAANILAWATGGALAISAIVKLIEALNRKSDNEVIHANQQLQDTGGLPPGFFDGD